MTLRGPRHADAAHAGGPDRELLTLLSGGRTLVLSGAGISTESGIPDYRSPERLQRNHQPLLYQRFVGDEQARRRYWARSLVGWEAVAHARPNRGHQAVAQLQRDGLVTGVITQNVDGLHQRAGSRDVVELHGSLATVGCLGCGARTTRNELQLRLQELNPEVAQRTRQLAPDGDADLADEAIAAFMVPDCDQCGGMLKPDVVFFGENVPAARVAKSWEMLDECDVLLVLGSSLTVMSGLRLVLAAHEAAKPIAIVNDGPTRADELATRKVEARLGDVLSGVAARLTSAE